MPHEKPPDSEDPPQDLAVETPVGKLAAKGFRVSDTIALLTLVGVAVLSTLMYMHMQQADQTNAALLGAIKQQTEVLGKLTEEQRTANRNLRKQTCLFSMPPERREAEYSQPYSQCNLAGAP